MDVNIRMEFPEVWAWTSFDFRKNSINFPEKKRYQNHTLASSQILSPLIFENPQLHDAVQVRPTASNMETDHGLEGPNQGSQLIKGRIHLRKHLGESL